MKTNLTVGTKVVIVEGYPEDIGFEGHIIEIGRDGTTAYVQMPGAQGGMWVSASGMMDVSEHSPDVVKTFSDTALEFEIDILTRTIEFTEEALETDKSRLAMLEQQRLDRIGYCPKCHHSWTQLVMSETATDWMESGTIYCGKHQGFGLFCECRCIDGAPESILDKFKVF